MTQSDKQAVINRCWKSWRYWIAHRDALANSCVLSLRLGNLERAQLTAEQSAQADKRAWKAFHLYRVFSDRKITA